jgi:hypothetical protein
MKTRILPPEEWVKLKTAFPPLGTTLRPGDSQVIVVEDGDRIVASLEVIRVTHFESLWIDPEYTGNAGLVSRLMKAAIDAARKWTDEWVWGASGTSKMNTYLYRMGGRKMPVETFVVPLQ